MWTDNLDSTYFYSCRKITINFICSFLQRFEQLLTINTIAYKNEILSIIKPPFLPYAYFVCLGVNKERGGGHVEVYRAWATNLKGLKNQETFAILDDVSFARK